MTADALTGVTLATEGGAPKSAPIGGQRWRLLTLAALGLTIFVLLADQYGLYLLRGNAPDQDEFLIPFYAMWGVQCLFYLCAVQLVRSAMPRGSLAVILAFGLVLRIIPLAAPSFLSTDINRYVWDGRVQDAGINPYCCIPAAPELSRLRDPVIYPNINRADYAPTIYPPAAQMLFAAVAAVSRTVLGMKTAMVLCEVLACICMLVLLGRAGLSRNWVLIYAWNPMVLWEFAGSGHVDAAATAWLALAMLASSSARPWVRAIGAGVALAGATLTKFLPIVVTPAFWRRDLRLPVVFVAAILAAYACYASVGWKVFGFLGGYDHEEKLSSGGGVYWLKLLAEAVAPPTWAGPAWLVLTALVLGGLALFVTLRAPRTNSPTVTSPKVTGTHAIVLATALIVMMTPHFTWYFGWLAFLACLVPLPSVLWLTVASVALHFDSYSVRWGSVIYLPFLVLAARDVARSYRRA
jgi:hypothetical protein